MMPIRPYILCLFVVLLAAVIGCGGQNAVALSGSFKGTPWSLNISECDPPCRLSLSVCVTLNPEEATCISHSFQGEELPVTTEGSAEPEPAEAPDESDEAPADEADAESTEADVEEAPEAEYAPEELDDTI
jgi:hypothetical protein